MAAVTGLTTVKRFTYRDNPNEEFSNTYHFKGPPPGDDASWMVLLTDVATHELRLMNPFQHLIRAYGYDSDDPHAHHVFTHDYTVPGPPPAGTGAYTGTSMAGDQAALAWWKTDKLSSRGKPIYLRKFWHGGTMEPGNPDLLDPSYHQLLQTYTLEMQTVHGGLRGRAQDSNVVQQAASTWVTTRTLKRRGKRPRTAS